jgi:hypothetical protein
MIFPDWEPDEILEDETKIWRFNENREIRVYKFGDIGWYQNGKVHREDGPAYTYPNGSQYWHQNGVFHRKDGPAIIHHKSKEWWLNGKLHRENGPAIEYSNGTTEWYSNGKRHREDGPAIEYSDGTKEWWLNDEKIIIKYNSSKFKKQWQRLLELEHIRQVMED